MDDHRHQRLLPRNPTTARTPRIHPHTPLQTSPSRNYQVQPGTPILQRTRLLRTSQMPLWAPPVRKTIPNQTYSTPRTQPIQNKQCDNTPCLFKHATRDTTFSLVVDDFGVSYRNSTDAQHLITTLRKLYEITVQTYGETYLGMKIQFNKLRTAVTVSMPGYIQNRKHYSNSGPTTYSLHIAQPGHPASMSHPSTDLNYHN